MFSVFLGGVFAFSLGLILKTPLFFVFQIVLQGQDSRPGRVSNVGEKSFRCDYDGCGKLYTTAHHLKVCVEALWKFFLFSCKIGLVCWFLCASSCVGLFTDI